MIVNEKEAQFLSEQFGAQFAILFDKSSKNKTTFANVEIVRRYFAEIDTVPAGYKDIKTINDLLVQYSALYPNLAQVIDIAKSYGPGSTINGRPIMAIKISANVTIHEDEPNILIVSCHHAREITTPEMALSIIDKLLTAYGRDGWITQIVNKYQIFVVPVVNPDGYDYVFTKDNWWRKNRRQVTPSVYGVDLNRNYELGWEKCVDVRPPSSETYKGAAPYSEPESTTIAALSRVYGFAKVLDFHSYGRQVLTGYECTHMPDVIRNYIQQQGLALANLAQYTTRLPSDDGEHQEMQIKNYTTFAFLTEMNTEFQPPFAQAKSEAARLWPLVQRFLNVSIPLQGHVFDQVTRQPLVARVDVAGIAWQAGESRYSNGKFGYYHLFLPNGAYSITFSAPGKTSQTIQVTIDGANTQNRDIYLN